MERLKQDYPSKDFCFVLGADLIDSLKTWDAPGVPDAGLRLWNECSFLVLDRPGYEIPENLPPNFIELTPLAGSTIVTEEVPSRTARAPTRTASPDRPAGDRPASDAEPDSKPRNPTPSPSLGPEPWPRAKRPRPRQVSSSEIRRRISKPKPQSHAVGLRRSSTGDNFGESEKHEIEQAMSSGGNFEMVDG